MECRAAEVGPEWRIQDQVWGQVWKETGNLRELDHFMMSDGNINFSTEIRREVLEIPRNMEFFDVEEG